MRPTTVFLSLVITLQWLNLKKSQDSGSMLAVTEVSKFSLSIQGILSRRRSLFLDLWCIRSNQRARTTPEATQRTLLCLKAWIRKSGNQLITLLKRRNSQTLNNKSKRDLNIKGLNLKILLKASCLKNRWVKSASWLSQLTIRWAYRQSLRSCKISLKRSNLKKVKRPLKGCSLQSNQGLRQPMFSTMSKKLSHPKSLCESCIKTVKKRSSKLSD